MSTLADMFTEKERALLATDCTARVRAAHAELAELGRLRTTYEAHDTEAAGTARTLQHLRAIGADNGLNLSPYRRAYQAVRSTHDAAAAAADVAHERYAETWRSIVAGLPAINALEQLLGYPAEHLDGRPLRLGHLAWSPTARDLAAKLKALPAPEDL